MVYVLYWALNYWSLLLWLIGLKNRLIFVVPFLFAAILIAFRNSGTDTAVYEQILATFASMSWLDVLSLRMEPGFLIVSKFLVSPLGLPPEVALRILGILFVFILGFAIRIADRNELLLFGLFYLPLVMISYGMNAVRAGLGLALFVVGVQMMRRGFLLKSILLFIIACLFHYSLLLGAGLLILLEFMLGVRPKTLVIVILVGVIPSIGILGFAAEWFAAKLELYSSPSDLVSPISGLSKVAIIGLLSLALWATNIPLKHKTISWLLIAASTLVSLFLLVKGSYAALRILDLISLLTPFLFLRAVDLSPSSRTRVLPLFFWILVGLAGAVGVALMYRNMLSDWGGVITGSETPFLPYRFIWEDR